MTDTSQSKLYTIVVFSEHHVGLLNQLSIIFTRRGLNIESITASLSSRPDVHKITITCRSNAEMMDKVLKQIEKRIDVIRAMVYTDDDLVYQEVALCKISTRPFVNDRRNEEVIRRHAARILSLTPDYTVIEKTGHIDEIQALFAELQSYDVKQFVRSGRVAIVKSAIEHVDEFLRRRDADFTNLDNKTETSC